MKIDTGVVCRRKSINVTFFFFVKPSIVLSVNGEHHVYALTPILHTQVELMETALGPSQQELSQAEFEWYAT
jgi:hypothetical protein